MPMVNNEVCLRLKDGAGDSRVCAGGKRGEGICDVSHRVSDHGRLIKLFSTREHQSEGVDTARLVSVVVVVGVKVNPVRAHLLDHCPAACFRQGLP